MKPANLLLAIVAVTASLGASATTSPAVPPYVAAAVASMDRPIADKAQDADRKPAQVLAFTGVRPGDKVVDLMPGSGYYTRVLSKLVGPRGKVYAVQPVEMDKAAPKGLQSLRTFAGKPAYANVVVLVQPVAAIRLPEPVDMVWTSQNYHDLHDPFMGSPDMARFDRSVLGALRPGGIFMVLDHAAANGSAATRTDDLHRIDAATVKAEVVAAGFTFVGACDVLRNPLDDRSLPIFDKSLRGRTDRFIYKFRKPRP